MCVLTSPPKKSPWISEKSLHLCAIQGLRKQKSSLDSRYPVKLLAATAQVKCLWWVQAGLSQCPETWPKCLYCPVESVWSSLWNYTDPLCKKKDGSGEQNCAFTEDMIRNIYGNQLQRLLASFKIQEKQRGSGFLSN